MNKRVNKTSKIRVEQVANQCEAIFLGADLHGASIMVTRILDHTNPQPAQRFKWAGFWEFAQKQTRLAKKVYLVYEAGAFGFWPARQLQRWGLEVYVCHPDKLDPRQKRVQTDQLDSRQLADKLQRYVDGNQYAMSPVYIPSEEEERPRLVTRHRRALHKELHRLQRRGEGLLRSQGPFATKEWWTEGAWKALQEQLCPELVEVLEDDRQLIAELEKRLKPVEKKVKGMAPKQRPKGVGALTLMLLLGEILNWQRFHNRRNVGGFTGLCGGVSSSGPYHLDLSINKAGSGYLRSLLVELAWRVVYWQPGYKGLKGWRRLKQSGALQNKRLRKMAIVGVARQLAVDLWRWQTGRVSPEELGWVMNGTVKAG